MKVSTGAIYFGGRDCQEEKPGDMP